jgi:hypothetical protein
MTLNNRNATFYTYVQSTYYPGSDILEGVDPERAPKVSPGPPVRVRQSAIFAPSPELTQPQRM